MKPLLFIAGLLGTATLGSGLLAWVNGNGDSDSQLPANAAPQRTAVTALGRLEPITRVIDVGGPESARVLSLAVAENDFVEANAEIGRLDDYPWKIATVEHRQAALKEAQDMLESEQALGTAHIAEADQKLVRITQLKPLEFRIQQAIVRRLESELDRLQQELKRLTNLEARNATTEGTVTDARSSTEQALAELEESKLTLERLHEQLRLDEVVAKAEAQSARSQSHRDVTAIAVSSAQANLTLAQAELEQSIIRAPVSGTILKIVTRPGERVTSDPIVQMGDTRQMYALAEIYETDVRFVRIGQTARLTSPALPEPLVGTVDEISLIVDRNSVLDIDPAAPIDSRVVEVRIRLENSELASQFVNLQVTVIIDIGAPAATP